MKREFQIGDEVLVLLPVFGSALSAKFSGQYVFCASVVVSSLPESDDAPVIADGLRSPQPVAQSARLPNAEMLQVLPTKLHQLSLDQQDDVVNLVTEFRCLLSNVPMQTTLIRHDIDV